MLLERMAAVQDSMGRLEDLKKLENRLERLRTRRDSLEAARKALEPQVDLLEAFKRHGIPVQHDDRPARLSESLRKTAERFHEDPATIMEPDPDLKYIFWDNPESPAVGLRLRLTTAWQDYVDSVVPPVNSELLDLLAAIPTFQAAVQHIRQVLVDIEDLRTRPPQSDGAFAVPETLAADLQRGLEHLANAGVTEAIERFLQQLTSGGARLSLLTPEVASWLEQNGIYDFLRIKM